MSRKLNVTELESRVAPTVFTNVGTLLSMLNAAGKTVPPNVRQVGNLNPDQQIAVPDSLWAQLQAGAQKARRG